MTQIPLVSCGTKSKQNFGPICICTSNLELLDLSDWGGVQFQWKLSYEYESDANGNVSVIEVETS